MFVIRIKFWFSFFLFFLFFVFFSPYRNSFSSFREKPSVLCILKHSSDLRHFPGICFRAEIFGFFFLKKNFFFNYLHWQRGTECQNYKAEVAQGLRIKTALLETCLKSKHFLGHVWVLGICIAEPFCLNGLSTKAIQNLHLGWTPSISTRKKSLVSTPCKQTIKSHLF